MCPWFDYIVCIGGKSFKIETLNNVYAICICKKASLICYPIFLTWEIALEFVPLLDAVKITLLVFLMFRNVEIILQLPCNNNKQTTNQKVYSWSNFNHKLSWCLIWKSLENTIHVLQCKIICICILRQNNKERLRISGKPKNIT